MKRLMMFGLLAAFIAGCGTATTIVLTDSTGVHVGTFEVADTPIPAVSYSTGPRFAAMTRKDCLSGLWVKGGATITNETHALGVYDSFEVKTLTVEAYACSEHTNVEAEVKAMVDTETARVDGK